MWVCIVCENTVNGCFCLFFTHIYRQAAVRTTGCLGDRFELMSLLAESQADTDTQPYHGIRSSPLSPGRSRCPLGFHSDQLKDRDTGQ